MSTVMLYEKIERLRSQLNRLARDEMNLVHPKIVTLSQELDGLIVAYQARSRSIY
ncbi:aspartyl-phosphate phosphatase Spo0E family protein [Gorillibacterium massiliense]|uniref:aspartyl-phosphate phosphatase Spo0E family protein n=1 Tax=Gorillibacterium massiliense TaxID=1280390 RepID=UPI0004AEAF77|nr:aspartyl-phosphate phosphatase Spo0E family protein [Gorillibacterium massiliense]